MPREPQESASKEQPRKLIKEEGKEIAKEEGNKSTKEEGEKSTKEEGKKLTKEEGKKLTKEKAMELTCCCCECCHQKSCYGFSKCLCNAFPQHNTANQFFTPRMFEAYHEEGRRACEEAKAYDFLKTACPEGDKREVSEEPSTSGCQDKVK